MKKTSPNVSYIDRIRSLAHGSSKQSASPSRQPSLPLTNQDTTTPAHQASTSNGTSNFPPYASSNLPSFAGTSSKPTTNSVADNTSPDHPEPAPPPQANGEGHIIERSAVEKKNIFMRFWLTTKSILFASYVNVLLIFVPIGIAAKGAGLSAGIVFGMNAVAIIPLAGLLSHATESVAKRMGDTVGALMNVTFGNAVELIILYVSLSQNQDPG